MSFLEQVCLVECTAELSTACYAGALLLQAMGLGGWMYDGIDPFTVLGAGGEANIPGLGFHYETDERAAPQSDGSAGRLRGVLPSLLSGHARGRRGPRRAQVRARRSV